jgi:hypothetical protein
MSGLSEQLYGSVDFWKKRVKEQKEYLYDLHLRFINTGLSQDRYFELRESALSVAERCNERIHVLLK